MSNIVISISEVNEYRNQKNKVYQALFHEPMTMLEVANQLNIFRANICRYVDEFEQKGLVVCTRKRRCTISGFAFVGEYTADPDLFPEDNQLKINFGDV